MENHPTPSRLACWTGPALITAVMTVLAWWSWGTWPDAIIDFGHELYVAWRLAAGQRLYIDIQHTSGPLSQYWNALLFQVFGVGLRTLVIANFVILAAITCLLYRLLRIISNRFAATLAVLTFATLFAFLQLVATGNYNYICPYRHDMTHGILLSLAGFAAFHQYWTNRRTHWLVATGLMGGLMLLTKPELAVAALAALGLGIILTWRIEQPPLRAVLREALALSGGLIIPLAIAWLGFARTRTFSEAGFAVFRGWTVAFSNNTLSASYFSRKEMGLLDLTQNLEKIFTWSAGYGLGIAILMILSLSRRPSERFTRVIAVLVFGVFIAGLAGWQSIPWESIAVPLPLVMIILGVTTARSLHRRRTDPAARQTLILRFILIAFAFVLLGRMFFNVRIAHYGFALAMPATLLACVALCDWLPAYVNRRGGAGLIVKSASLGFLTLVIVIHLHLAQHRFTAKTFHIGQGVDDFRADQRAQIINASLATLAQQSTPEQMLVCFPEGEMVNYLARRVYPTRYIVYMPSSIDFDGETNELIALQQHPPDWVALVHLDTSDNGPSRFGQDYGRKLYQWVIQNYRGVTGFNLPPEQNFGILLCQRKPAPSPQP